MLSSGFTALELLPLVWAGTALVHKRGGDSMKEVVFLGGCPHCGDAIPAIVTMIIHEPHDTEVSYYGEVSDELKFELSCKPSARIFACKKINEEE